MGARRRVISWFSCGAASACATKLILDECGKRRVTIAYCDTGSEHPDSRRFFRECEEWFGQKIVILKSTRYFDIWDVFEETGWLVGPKGARCTTELKKKVRNDFEDPSDIQVFGYTFDEKEIIRHNDFIKNTPEIHKIRSPLIEQKIPRWRCYEMLNEAGIDLPIMYKLGYNNNNCIGCVKGQQGYWNKIRVDFPDVFDRMAKTERRIGAAINKTYKGDKVRKVIYLDELDPNAGRYDDEPDIFCGINCSNGGV